MLKFAKRSLQTSYPFRDGWKRGVRGSVLISWKGLLLPKTPQMSGRPIVLITWQRANFVTHYADPKTYWGVVGNFHPLFISLTPTMSGLVIYCTFTFKIPFTDVTMSMTCRSLMWLKGEAEVKPLLAVMAFETQGTVTRGALVILKCVRCNRKASSADLRSLQVRFAYL
jgi:hypothetical protein